MIDQGEPFDGECSYYTCGLLRMRTNMLFKHKLVFSFLFFALKGKKRKKKSSADLSTATANCVFARKNKEKLGHTFGKRSAICHGSVKL